MPVYLALTEVDAPGCPVGSAIGRFDLDEVAEGAWPGLVLVPDDGRDLWVPPPPVPPVPASITNFQVRAVLMGMPSPTGIAGRTLFQDIDDTLRAEGGLAWSAWEYANEVTRGGELVNSLGARLGLSPAQLDQMFTMGAEISA